MEEPIGARARVEAVEVWKLQVVEILDEQRLRCAAIVSGSFIQAVLEGGIDVENWRTASEALMWKG